MNTNQHRTGLTRNTAQARREFVANASERDLWNLGTRPDLRLAHWAPVLESRLDLLVRQAGGRPLGFGHR